MGQCARAAVGLVTILLASGALAQGTNLDDLERRVEAAKKTEAARSTQRAVSPRKSSSSASSLATLLISTDADCELIVNGVAQGRLSVGAARSLQLRAGEQIVECKSSDSPGVVARAVKALTPSTQSALLLEVAALLPQGTQAGSAQPETRDESATSTHRNEPQPAIAPTATPAEQAAYSAAFELLKAGQYAGAAQSFSKFVGTYPTGELTPNAMYWLGESYYVTQNYRIALDTFRDLVARFPEHVKVPDAMLKTGYCHFELGELDEARAQLERVVSLYPDTTVARLAQGRLRALQGSTPRR